MKFTPIIPPIIPAKIAEIIIIMDLRLSWSPENTMLDETYKKVIYINPTMPPFIIPFLFIFLVLFALPIRILIAVIIITIGVIVLSGILEYVSIVANINKKINVCLLYTSDAADD